MAFEHSPSCEDCDGSGFIILADWDGPGMSDEDNCNCTDAVKISDLCDECELLNRAAVTP